MPGIGQCALIAAEEAAVRARFARLLRSAGFDLELASSWQGVLKLTSKQRFDIGIVVPSAALPLITLEELRQHFTKILVLAETRSDIDELKSLVKADAFLPISVTDEDLLDQLKRMLDRAEATVLSSPVLLGNCRLDFATQAFVDSTGREIQLTAAETALLRELAREVGQVRSRDQLYQAVTGRGADRFDRSLDMLVVRLRKKIEPDPRSPQFILTVPGIGYKLLTQTADDAKHVLTKDAQRRQLTILKCSIAHWTALAFDCDPEELSEISSKFRAISNAVIASMGGTIFSQRTEAFRAYFCYPDSTERDAEFAVKAALQLLQQIRAIEGTTKKQLQVKIGVATGVAVLSGIEAVGEPIGAAVALCDAAAPNSLLVDANTRKLLDSGFSIEPVELYRIPGAFKSIAGFRVVAEHAIEARAEPPLASGELIGRDHELQQLFRLWERAKRWHGQVAVVSGEPGIGKSHLCEAFIERVSKEPHQLLRYHCSPILRNSPLHPIITQIEHEFGLLKEDAAGIKLEKIRSALSKNPRSKPSELSLYTDILSLDGDSRSQSKANTKQNRDRLIARLSGHAADLALHQPLIVVIANPQWADSSTLQFIDQFVRNIRAARALLLFQCRPEYSPSWLGASHVTLLSIDRLGRDETLELLSRIPGANSLTPEIKEQITVRSDGVPLFIEEITKSVLESAGEGDVVDTSGTALEVPTTLLGSLTARLDRLGDAREIAQLAAAVGPECPYNLLKQIADIRPKKLDDRLQRLLAAELMYCKGANQNAIYTFKHALVREAAYNSMLKSRRAHLHEVIANALIQQVAGGVPIQAELIAYHYTQAEKHQEALQYWYEAARYAAGRSAHKEAIAHLKEALKQASLLDDSVLRNKTELRLQTLLGNSLRAIEGWTAEPVKAAYSRALQLSNSDTPIEDVFGPVFGLWAWNFVRPLLGEAEELAGRLMSFATSMASPVYEVLGRQALGFTFFAQGRFENANTELERSIRLCDDEQASAYLALSGQDPRVHARLYRAMVVWFLGFPDQALALCAEALHRAELFEDPFSEAMAQSITLRINQLRGEPTLVSAEADAVVELCKEHGFVHYLAMALILRGWARATQGEIDNGIAEMNEGLRYGRVSGALLYESYALGLMADACIKNERYEQALGFLRRAVQLLDRDHSERFYSAEIYRLKGEASFRLSGNPGDAEPWISRGLELAREQKAKSLELKLYLTLSDVCHVRDPRKFNRSLRELVQSFKEGYDTSDLIKAGAILKAPEKANVRTRKAAVARRRSKVERRL